MDRRKGSLFALLPCGTSFLLSVLVLLSGMGAPRALAEEPNRLEFTVASRDGQSRFGFSFSSISVGCSFGEINMFDQESRQGPKMFRLLLTLEEPVSKDEALQWVELSQFDRKKPFTVSLSVPTPEAESFLGVYLCTDWKNGRSCKDKISRPVSAYFDGKDPHDRRVKVEQVPQQDELFSFFLISLDEHRGRVWRSTERDEAVAAMQRAGASSEKVAAVRALMNDFSGEPSPAVDDGVIQLRFGYRDRERCSDDVTP